jgi:hypothetical protein
MSPHRSPWADIDGFPEEPDERPSTEELLAEFAEETEERIREEHRNRQLWLRFAPRLRADGGLII